MPKDWWHSADGLFGRTLLGFRLELDQKGIESLRKLASPVLFDEDIILNKGTSATRVIGRDELLQKEEFHTFILTRKKTAWRTYSS